MNNSLKELQKLVYKFSYGGITPRDVDYVNGVILFYDLKIHFDTSFESLLKVIKALEVKLNANSL